MTDSLDDSRAESGSLCGPLETLDVDADGVGLDAHRAEDRCIGASKGVLTDPYRTGVANKGALKVGDVIISLQPDYVVGKHRLEQLQAARQRPKHLASGPGNVMEVANLTGYAQSAKFRCERPIR